MKFKVLVLVAHSDDEAIGMGGTIKHANQGDNVKVISMTDGLSSRSKANKSTYKKEN